MNSESVMAGNKSDVSGSGKSVFKFGKSIISSDDGVVAGNKSNVSRFIKSWFGDGRKSAMSSNASR